MFLINDPFTVSVHGLQLCTVTLKTVVDRQSSLADIIVQRKQQKLTDKHNTSVRCELSWEMTWMRCDQRNIATKSAKIIPPNVVAHRDLIVLGLRCRGMHAIYAR